MSRSETKNSVTRRDALTTIGIAGAAAAMVGAGAAELSNLAGSGSASNGDEPRAEGAAEKPVAQLDEQTHALFAPLMAAGRVGDYRLVAVHATKLGAIPVVLATADGTRFQVDVLRHDVTIGGENGVRAAGSFTVVLHNQGRGGDPTDEVTGLGAMALLDALVAREGEGATVPVLATLRERTSRFPQAAFTVA